MWWLTAEPRWSVLQPATSLTSLPQPSTLFTLLSMVSRHANSASKFAWQANHYYSGTMSHTRKLTCLPLASKVFILSCKASRNANLASSLARAGLSPALGTYTLNSTKLA
eukprot:GHRR01034605.1.p1 GENE.GHRR01034605.1~~GHRR01034605.1.p1  ORF type:complete len:110 (-),score=8.54 GHRR01034605.1:407-736(-)